MAVQLPKTPYPWSAKPRLMDFGGDLTPPLGGPVQRVTRVGSRFAVDVVMPPINSHWAQEFIAARIKARATGSTLIMDWPKSHNTSSFGSPVVDGASQTGSTLNVKTVGNGVIRAGTMFSFLVSGRNYLHMVTDMTPVPTSGNVALPIAPMLRASPADGAAVNFDTPQIEGFISGTTEEWDVDLLTRASSFGFTIAEVQ